MALRSHEQEFGIGIGHHRPYRVSQMIIHVSTFSRWNQRGKLFGKGLGLLSKLNQCFFFGSCENRKAIFGTDHGQGSEVRSEAFELGEALIHVGRVIGRENRRHFPAARGLAFQNQDTTRSRLDQRLGDAPEKERFPSPMRARKDRDEIDVVALCVVNEFGSGIAECLNLGDRNAL